MDGNRSNRILDEWDAVASAASRPAAAPRPRNRGFGAVVGLAGAALAAVAIVVGLSWLDGRIAGPSVGSDLSPSPSPAIIAVASASPSPSLAPSASAEPTPSPSPTPAPTPGPCDPRDLHARIDGWDGAAGSQIATVTLVYGGRATCILAEVGRPSLIDAAGTVLATGGAPTNHGTFKLAAGAAVTTLVRVSNVCIDPVKPPVTVTFDLNPGGYIVATPVSTTDATVPPCNGPGQPAFIEMQAWKP